MDGSCTSYLSAGVSATRFAPVYVYVCGMRAGIDRVSVVPVDTEGGPWPDSITAEPRVRVQGSTFGPKGGGAWVDAIGGADFHSMPRVARQPVRDPFARNLSWLASFEVVV